MVEHRLRHKEGQDCQARGPSVIDGRGFHKRRKRRKRRVEMVERDEKIERMACCSCEGLMKHLEYKNKKWKKNTYLLFEYYFGMNWRYYSSSE